MSQNHPQTKMPTLYRFEVYRNDHFLGSVHARDLAHAYYLANAAYGMGIRVSF